MPLAAADLALHKPIRLSRAGPGASDSVIWSGVASADDLLHGYPMGTAEVTRQARIDTARGLVGVKVVSPEDHQAWRVAHERGQPYDERALGTVIDADYHPETDSVRFRMSVHDAEANRRIALKGQNPDALPAVSVAYEADIGEPSTDRADFAKLGRRVRHLALVPAGRDTQALILRDAAADAAASGASMPTLAELKATHPKVYADARKALRISRLARVATADALSLDKAIPVIREMLNDEVGQIVLHALANAPAELAEIERGVEEIDLDPATAEEQEAVMDDGVKPGDKKPPMTDGYMDALKKTVEDAMKPYADRLAALEKRAASADAAATAEDALKGEAAQVKSALDRLGVATPDGFSVESPTPKALADARDLVVRTIAGAPASRRWTAGFVPAKTWDGAGRRTDTGADGAANASPLSVEEL